MSTKVRPILPWAALAGLAMSGLALALARLQIVTRESLLLWPTYQLLRLDALHGGRWDLLLFFLGFQAFVWFLMISTTAVIFRWLRLLSSSRSGRNHDAA